MPKKSEPKPGKPIPPAEPKPADDDPPHPPGKNG